MVPSTVLFFHNLAELVDLDVRGVTCVASQGASCGAGPALALPRIPQMPS